MDARHNKAKHFLHHGLFGDVSSFSDLEKRIENLDSRQDKGDAFEVFAQAYLATQKIVQAKQVWPFEHLPENLKASLSIDTQTDMGVDGAFEMFTGEQCAYQVKFRTGRPHLTWTELSTFMGMTEQADKRVLFTNCDDIPDLMNDRSNFYCIRGSDLDGLGSDDFGVIEAWLKAGQVKFKHKDPLPHQKEALHAIESALKKDDRATLIMACGTGKTLVSLWTAEMLNVKSVLVLVPSLALVRQTLHEWLKQTKWESFSYLCVCSDPSVTKGSDELIVRQSELDFPVTTNSEEVARYLNTKTKGPHIVFSTYQSAKAVAEGMPDKYAFDLCFFDEAHKTAGREGTRFAYALNDENMSIKKRLFMTATPRHYDVRKKDKDGDAKLVYSMDVPDVYGKPAYVLQFRQAIKDKLICDYKVLISVVTSEEIDDWQLSHGEVVVQGDAVKARQVANQIALRNAVDKYKVKRIFTFHSSVKSAKSFTSPGGEGINSELPSFIAVHVNGSMPAAKRNHIMREFEQASQAVVSNARCLTEGVDVPAVDMVAFLSPKKSKVDIVQATGRAMRKSDNKDNGYVLVPLYLEQEKGESLEEALERTDYSVIWNVLQAIKEQDGELADVIRKLQEEKGKTGGFNDSRIRKHIEILGPALSLATLRKSVITQCVEWLGDKWDYRFGELIAFKEANGNCRVLYKYPENPQLSKWVEKNREKYKHGKLNEERIRRLEEIGFVWKQYESIWEDYFNELKAYKEANGDCNVPDIYPENPQLSKWVGRHRYRYKLGKIDEERIRRLEEIGFEWSVLKQTGWNERYSELKAYKDVNGDCRVPQGYLENPKLARWVNRHRYRYKIGKLGEKNIRLLEEIGFEWAPDDVKWEERFSELKAYKEANGHCNVPQGYLENPKLARWVVSQRVFYKGGKHGKLNEERIRRLEEIGFVWNARKKTD